MDNMIKKESYMSLVYVLYIFLVFLYGILCVNGSIVSADIIKPPISFSGQVNKANYVLHSIVPFVSITIFISLLMHLTAKKIRRSLLLPMMNIILSGLAIIVLSSVFLGGIIFADSKEIVIHEIILMLCKIFLLVDSVIMLFEYFTLKSKSQSGSVT